MTNEDFDKLVETQLNRCREVLAVKGKYYERLGIDRLGQFKRIGDVRRVGALDALAGMMAKHTDKLYDCILRDESDLEVWDEVITDHINYLLLLQGVVMDIEPEKKATDD
jgi:hypothetical protein